MQSQVINPWLNSYIEQHYLSKSRYDIDRYLINAGYDPKEIEEAWAVLLRSSSGESLPKKRSRKRRIGTLLALGMVAFIFMGLLQRPGSSDPQIAFEVG